MRRSRFIMAGLATVVLVALSGGRVAAWWNDGHKALSKAAAAKLPDDMPEFFRKAGEELAEMSTEPDRWKDLTTPHLRNTEAPEHFIDIEYLDGKDFPATRFEITKHYVARKLDLNKAGFLPYAIIEGYQRLQLAFRDYRSKPESAAVKQRIVVYAGWLAHYCQDAAMPLHTTINFNGKLAEGGPPKQKGIHDKIDAYPEKFLKLEEIVDGLKADDHVDVWTVIIKAIRDSHANVERCYELDLEGGFDTAPEKGKALMLQQAQAGAKLTVDLWYSAWKNSAPERATVPQPK
jgi:hypothetical protein